MTTYDIALIGFGGVNRTLAELVATRGETLRSELGFGLRVVAITDLRLGSLVQPEGDRPLHRPQFGRWKRNLRRLRRVRGHQ